MSTPEQLIFARLDADADLTARQAKAYPVLAPQDAVRPYLVYRRAATRFVNSIDGGTGTAGIDFELVTYADTYAEARETAAEARASLDGHRDQASTPKIDRVLITGESDGSGLDVLDGQELPVFTVQQTYSVTYEES